ncbi:phosphoglycerate mutase-like protein [Punctularia strigosozonata HHB-11173 SS5]|uniref:phosphoglycerate mutase-like protein n=1 Tax=Punctularia strigosozonata (strain HHB-11173) TaxID=741275 RepID=UPI000441824F|nr:phosphoglycerate mutase-like protein [Punctularia strigosozonata HHB-11173 SS5]EIN13824.1 phosphoglycerate mutase-like protein [Punctularia strigosozonata HHB-11173 SS5]
MDSNRDDLESGRIEYKTVHDVSDENQALLSSDLSQNAALDAGLDQKRARCCASPKPRFSLVHLGASFVVGIFATFLAQYLLCGSACFPRFAPAPSPSTSSQVDILASPDAGSTEVHRFPPIKPTNAFPSLFPTDVGYPGPTPTGAEPAVIATAPSYPVHTSVPHLLAPAKLQAPATSNKFDLFKSWGNLSPWYSVPKDAFGLDSSPEAPETCRITGLHFLHRHGARYPTGYASYGGPANFSSRLHATASGWNTSGELEFLNDWTYKLGEEVLTPFGRQQLYDLGIGLRMKYGFLLKNFTEKNTIPVFRTESQDRMLASALNFAIGFFGYPYDGMYEQSITIEEDGFNNTLAPYKTCPNARVKTKSDRGVYYVSKWAEIYLKDANARLAPLFQGYSLSIEDTFVLQQMCAYETVAIGYSKFCELFTQEEWEGFDYAWDLYFWYDSAFGSPVAKVQGIGYVQEMIARLTHTPIAVHNSSTNATLDDDERTFPLGQSLYVDATHEVVVLNILTALNLTTLAANGPLPADHIPSNRSFKVSHLAPFATNVQFQLLSCDSDALPGDQIRVIVNDGVVPLTGIRGCPQQKDGMCPVDAFVAAQKEIIAEADWAWGCHGDWDVPEGEAWNTTTGSPPPKP